MASFEARGLGLKFQKHQTNQKKKMQLIKTKYKHTHTHTHTQGTKYLKKGNKERKTEKEFMGVNEPK